MFRVVCTIVMLWFVSPTATAEPLGQSFDSSVQKRKTRAEKEAEIAAAEAEEEASKENYARVIVLRWPGVSTDHTDLNLQRNVRSAIGKSDALFLPAIDLYQDGREVKDTTLAPEMQPSKVSEDDVDIVLQTITKAKRLQYEDVDINEWQGLGLKYRKNAENIWFVDRPELREPLFKLYAEIGRTAAYMDTNSAPLFEYVGGRNVNYYWYLAATMAYYEPELLQQVDDLDTQGNIEYYVDLLQKGVFPSMKVDFQTQDQFDLESFTKEYEVLINGLPVEVDDNGELDVFLGRSDISLNRKDEGVGLSERYETIKTEDKAYRVLENARKRMELDFVAQLFLRESECTPQVDSDILTYLSIYAKMHPEVDTEIYISVPKAGNPNKVWVWRFDPTSTTLSKVKDGIEEFPVHFVATMGTGMLYNGFNLAFNTPDPDDIVNGSDPMNAVDLDGIPANMPFAFDLRAHYTKFMLQIGVEYGLNVSGEEWIEYYQTPGNEDPNVATVRVEDGCLGVDDRQRIGDPKGCRIEEEVYRTARFSKHRYVGAAYLFGRDSAYGYGLRTGLRYGRLNMPNSNIVTANVGYSYLVDIYELGERVRPVVDADIRLGTVWVDHRSLIYDTTEVPSSVAPIFGFTLSAGTTF